MHLNKLALAVASLATVAFVNASFDLDSDDIPRQCRDVCDPVRRLGDICDVDDDPLDDRTEDLLEAQCYCTNDSFNVNRITAQCASCMHEHQNDRDDLEDIDDIMRSCGFSSTSYNEADIATVTNINVQATRPTDAADLTTTITGAQATRTGGGGGGNGGGGNGDGGNGGDDDYDDGHNGGGGNGDGGNGGGDGGNAAPGLTAGFGFGSLGVTVYVGLSAIAGAMLLQ
ncbi:hypothetical protein ACRALDRAFT_1082384 [Sodiomyces alcalophilus JCM 7366]|uniref:uncharacterized protein n=1 Tax=Sodiomyces alcalophilus JCM 7366 TaxID=591952 RepID=UPI0039B4077F